MKNQAMLISQKKKVIKALKEVGFNKLPYFKVRDIDLNKGGEDYFGLFIRNTQFTKHLEILINVEAIKKNFKYPTSRLNEIAVTIAHEFGHSFVEVMETYEGTDVFENIDWRKELTDDEEEFVELFAVWLMDGTLLDRPFFSEFIPILVKGYEELLQTEEIYL